MPEGHSSGSWFAAYAVRNAILADLGYPTYKAYLESSLWNAIRQRVLSKLGRGCYVCGFTARTIHHRQYAREVLTGDTLDGLTPLCKECHNKIEFAENLKLSLSEANTRLDAMKIAFEEHKQCERVLQEAMKAAKASRAALDRFDSNAKVLHTLTTNSCARPTKKQFRRAKRERRRQRQRQEFVEYQARRQQMLEHKASIVTTKPVMAAPERRDDPPAKTRVLGFKTTKNKGKKWIR